MSLVLIPSSGHDRHEGITAACPSRFICSEANPSDTEGQNAVTSHSPNPPLPTSMRMTNTPIQGLAKRSVEYVELKSVYKELLQMTSVCTFDVDSLLPPDQRAIHAEGAGVVCQLRAKVPQEGFAIWQSLESACRYISTTQAKYRRHVITEHLGCHPLEGLTLKQTIEKRLNEVLQNAVNDLPLPRNHGNRVKTMGRR